MRAARRRRLYPLRAEMCVRGNVFNNIYYLLACTTFYSHIYGASCRFPTTPCTARADLATAESIKHHTQRGSIRGLPLNTLRRHRLGRYESGLRCLLSKHAHFGTGLRARGVCR